MKRQATPVHISGKEPAAHPLTRWPPEQKGQYDESWIQDLIHRCPSVLPITELEPGFFPAISVCKELPLSSGSLDNLLITPEGNLVLVECKLWRNPQARREVVAQVVDYAKDLQALDYSGLEESVSRARKEQQANLYELAQAEVDESDFVDAVQRNLSRGRALLIIAGDGITENVEAISEFLQQNAGLHFTLGIVQLAVYQIPDSADLLVVPSVPLKTTNIVRGIVLARDQAVEIQPAPETSSASKAKSLSEEEFMTQLDAHEPGTSDRLVSLIEKGRDTGIFSTVGKLMMVRLALGETNARLFSVNQDGNLEFTYLGSLNPGIDHDTIRTHLKKVAEVFPSAHFYETQAGGSVRKNVNGYVTVWDLLDQGDEWLEEVARFRQEALPQVEQT